MATKTKTVVVCDRDGKEIKEDEQSLRLTVKKHKKTRGRQVTQEIDLCESCAGDFLKFVEGPEQGLTANQRVAEGMI